MKKSSFLTLLPCCVALVAPICSCSNQKSEAEQIADAIFGPVQNKHKEQKTNDFENVLKNFTEEERKNELLYDLFGWCNEPSTLIGGQTFWDLYSNNTVSLKTLVNKCTLSDNLRANFLGYISFIFEKEWTSSGITYKANDYVQITFNLSDIQPEINNNQCCLKYYDATEPGKSCIGFIKQRCEGGKEHMYSIPNIDTGTYTTTKIFNSQNYIPDEE